MRVDYAAIKADADANGWADPDVAYAGLIALTHDVPRASYQLNERTITRALIVNTATPYADAQAFIDGVAAAGAAGVIPNYLVDDLAGTGLDVCDPLISAALTNLIGQYNITTTMVTKLLALRSEVGAKAHPGLKRGHVVDAFHKAEAGYGEGA